MTAVWESLPLWAQIIVAVVTFGVGGLIGAITNWVVILTLGAPGGPPIGGGRD